MARRPNKHLRQPRPLLSAREVRKQSRAGGVFLVREVPADRAVKHYTCPGCRSPIQPGTSHLVVWPETPGFGHSSGLDERRHWHPHCWRIAR